MNHSLVKQQNELEGENQLRNSIKIKGNDKN